MKKKERRNEKRKNDRKESKVKRYKKKNREQILHDINSSGYFLRNKISGINN